MSARLFGSSRWFSEEFLSVSFQKQIRDDLKTTSGTYNTVVPSRFPAWFISPIPNHLSVTQTWFWGVCSSVTPKLIKFLKSSENSEQKLCFWHVLVISNRFKQQVLEISKSEFFLLKKNHFWGVDWIWAWRGFLCLLVSKIIFLFVWFTEKSMND